MYDRRLVAGGAAVGLVAVAIIAFVLAAPRLAASGLNGLAQQQLGRSVWARHMSPSFLRSAAGRSIWFITSASLYGQKNVRRLTL